LGEIKGNRYKKMALNGKEMTVGLEPLLRFSVAGEKGFNIGPECRGMIPVFQVSQFVNDNIVNYIG